MLELGVKADAATRFGFLSALQLHDFGEGRDLIEAVVTDIARSCIRNALLGAQGAQFGERKVLGKPARDALTVDHLVAATILEFLATGDIGRAGQLVFMARDEHQILGNYKIGLDIIGALFDRELVCGKRVLGPLAACAAMSDDDRIALGKRREGKCKR